MFSHTNPDFGRKYASPSSRGSISPSGRTPMSSMTLPTTANSTALSSTERRHYNRALKELCKILRLDSQRIDETIQHGVEDDESSLDRKTLRQQTGHTEEDTSFRASDDPSTSFHQLYESEECFMPKSPMKKRWNKEEASSRMEEEVSKVEAVKDVYAELATINRKLQQESAILHERELDLMERERALDEREQTSLLERDQSVHHAHREVGRRFAELKEQHQSEISKWHVQLQDKSKENKRLKSSFETLKQANDSLRKQLSEIQEQNKRLESQAVNVQSRLANLQRKQELTARQRELDSVSLRAKAENRQQLLATKDNTDASKAAGQAKHTSSTKPAAVYDVMGVLLEWLSEVHLRNTMTADCIKQPLIALPTPELTKERCTKILPSIVEVLHCLPPSSSKIHLPCLQFIYWSLVHLDQSQQPQQRNPLSATYRRLGEELYKPTTVRFAVGTQDVKVPDGLHEKPKAAIFYRSPNLHIRLLSCLIIMKTLSQVDVLALVFDVLRADLKEESAKELFLGYQATQVVTPFLKMTNKALVTSAIDVCLQMSMESVLTQEFLDSCCNDTWFRACATVLRTPNLDSKTWEKLSIILQKLSKIKSNKRHFEVQGITSVVQEMLRTGFQDNTFLSLNLRSILFNFNIAKRSPIS
ncbi:coiled-coil domain-containing protein 138-like isoform X1 [Asterias amurensis]|uniref:coiled-coil domain-containing protein 138-like isoform X1 n=1 Tax=Asterias amurensis TaxID=7602 RepID=UPI003AB71876